MYLHLTWKASGNYLNHFLRCNRPELDAPHICTKPTANLLLLQRLYCPVSQKKGIICCAASTNRRQQHRSREIPIRSNPSYGISQYWDNSTLRMGYSIHRPLSERKIIKFAGASLFHVKDTHILRRLIFTLPNTDYKYVLAFWVYWEYSACSTIIEEFFLQYFEHYCDHSVIRIWRSLW